MVVRFKAFKPEYYDEDAFKDAMRNILQKTQKDFKDGFDQSVETWNHQPKFASDLTVDGQRAQLVYGTDDDIYGYVNDGTPPHDITPKRAKRLRFKTGYRAKTQRGSLRSGSGGASGSYVSARKVHHPGTEAREFDKEVVRRTKPKFERYCTEEIGKAVTKRKARP